MATRSRRQRGITPDLGGKWKVDCQYRGQKIRKRGFTDYRSAEDFLIRQKNAIHESGISSTTQESALPVVTLEEAAAKYLEQKVEKGMPSAETDAYLLEPVIEMLGSLTLEEICNDTIAPFIQARRAKGIKNKSINNALSCINRICKLANTKWRHPGTTYPLLATPVTIDMLDLADQRPPRPITWSEQKTLFEHLPPHLSDMALFVLNTGARKSVVCQLRWQWEVGVKIRSGQQVSVFVVPRQYVKGRKRERVLICNTTAQEIIDRQRGHHDERVFTYYKQVKKGGSKPPKFLPIADMHNTAWQRARVSAGLDDLHVHDLRHTVGMRLRHAGVSERTQDEILWHSRKDMTAHYAVAQIREVFDALELISQEGQMGETLNLLAIVRRAQIEAVPAQVTQNSHIQRKTA
tara:strand:+ start:17007 stop:18227 length:1221 start_codon:yes stop_codon:yes gene_type:complete